MPNINEVRIPLSPRLDDYLVLSLDRLTKLNKLLIDGQLLEFKPSTAAAAEVLHTCTPPKGRQEKKYLWKPVYTRDMRIVCRRLEDGIVEVFTK